MDYNFNSKFNRKNFNQPNSNQSNFNQPNSNQTNPKKKWRNRGRKRFRNNQQQNNQQQCFFNDDIQVNDYYDFRLTNRSGNTLDDLMKLVKERKHIGLDFLDRLVIKKLNSDEESDVLKIIIKKLLNLLHAYQLSILNENEKSIVKSRGHLKFES